MKKLILCLAIWMSCHAATVIADSPKNLANQRARQLAHAVARLVALGGGSLLKESERSQLPPRLADWIEANRPALVGGGVSPFAESPAWGVVTTRENNLFLMVMKWPRDGKLLLPRLHNSVESVQLDSHALKLKPNVADWEISLPPRPPAKSSLLPVVTMRLNSPPRTAPGTPPVVTPNREGALLLHARDAIVHGEMLRFEPQPHKNTIGYWVNQDDWAEWRCQPRQSHMYEVTLRYGCGDGQGGSEVDFEIGSEKLSFEVEATGGFQSWRDVVLGTIELKPAEVIKVTAKPRKKAKNAVMDIQQITLRPR